MLGPWIKVFGSGQTGVAKVMARVNIDILGISELKWTGMGECNSDDHYIYYCGQESLRRNGVALIVHKSPKSVLGCNLKNNRMISIHFQGKPFNITIIQVYALTNNPEEAEVEWFYEDLQDLLELTPKKDVLFFIRSDQIRSVTQSCPTLCDSMNHSTPGLPVHHQLPEFTQTHVHRVSDAIQPSHPLSSPSPPAPNPSQHQSLFQ